LLPRRFNGFMSQTFVGRQMVTWRGFGGAVSPFVPVLIGMILKFSLLDKPPDDVILHFESQYVVGIWIDFIATAYIAGVAWFWVRRKAGGSAVFFLLIVPLICFVVCAGMALGLPKAGVTSEFWILWAPALVGALSVALAGNALAVAD
jgi:hypothetical protein